MKNLPTFEITIDEAISKIKSTKGKFFGATFIRRTDGTIRNMNARSGVKKYLKGGALNYDPIAKKLIPTFDMKITMYRSIPEEGILSFRFQKKEFIIV